MPSTDPSWGPQDDGRLAGPATLTLRDDDAATSGPALSEREREVLALIARGHSNAMIAAELYLSVDTAKSRTRTLFRTLDVRNRTQEVVAAATVRVADPRRSVDA